MRYWSYDQPTWNGGNETITVSDDDIIEQYWPWWYDAMCKKFGKEHVDENYSREECIQDYVVVHWARESTPE